MNDVIYNLLTNEKEEITIEKIIKELRKRGAPEEKLDMVKKAYEFAFKIHEGQPRESGEPYIVHPLHVAWNLLCMNIYDVNMICAGLLHDTLEDADAEINLTKDVLESEFNKDIAHLVDGVTKIKIKTDDKNQINFRKIVEGLTVDPRIIFIKLADRLHNMATLQYKKKKNKIIENAQETLMLYVPLAQAVGAHQVSNVLRDLSLKFLDEEAYNTLTKLKEARYEREKEDLIEFQKALQEKLNKAGIQGAQVIIRDHTIHTLYEKLKSNSKEINEENFQEIDDVFYFKVVVDNRKDIPKADNIIKTFFPPVPGTEKDYITNPKGLFYFSKSMRVGYKYFQRKVKLKTKFHDELARFGLPFYWNLADDSRLYEWSKNKLLEDRYCQTIITFLNKYNNDVSGFYNELQSYLKFPKIPILIYDASGKIVNYSLPANYNTIEGLTKLCGDNFCPNCDTVIVNGTPYSAESERPLKEDDRIVFAYTQKEDSFPGGKVLQYSRRSTASA